MRQSIVTLVLVVLATGPLEPRHASAEEIPHQQFSDWYFFYCAGQRALGRGDLDIASRRYREAIKLAWPSAKSDPRLLARTYNDFAVVLLLQGRGAEAEPLAEWALHVRERRFGKQSPQTASSLHVLAQLASARMEYGRAEDLLTRAVAIWEESLGADHPQMVVGLNDLATLYNLDRKYPQAERLFQRVLDMPATALPPIHPYRLISLIGLASSYTARGQYDRAETADFTLLSMMDRMPPMIYQEIAPSLDVYLTQLRKLGRMSEAEALESSARASAGRNAGPPPFPANLLPRRPPRRPRST
jgi:tetratricopeptide (TPR) repeat protein